LNGRRGRRLNEIGLICGLQNEGSWLLYILDRSVSFEEFGLLEHAPNISYINSSSHSRNVFYGCGISGIHQKRDIQTLLCTYSILIRTGAY
jgi:hypothetical protein